MTLVPVKVKLATELYDFIYRRSLGTRFGISGYLRGLAERDMAEASLSDPSIIPEHEKEVVS